MPFSTYSDLAAAIPDYLERSDLGAFVPRWIGLAEKRLERRLNLAGNETQVRLDLVAGRAPLPNDYGAWRAVNGPHGRSLDYAPPHVFIGRYGGGYGLTTMGQGDGYDDVADGVGCGGRPALFTILGSVALDDIDADVSIWPNGLNNPFILTGPAYAGQISLVYRQGIPPLSDAQPTNWLLDKAPDLYLYAALLEAEPFLRNDGRVPLWKAALEEALGDLQSLDREARWGRARIRTLEPTP